MHVAQTWRDTSTWVYLVKRAMGKDYCVSDSISPISDEGVEDSGRFSSLIRMKSPIGASFLLIERQAGLNFLHVADDFVDQAFHVFDVL